MATAFSDLEPIGGDTGGRARYGGLERADRAIGGPVFDALTLWGAPILALMLMTVAMIVIAVLPPDRAAAAALALTATIAVLTYAHLIAVVPRAYLNRDVFAAHRLRLTIVPVVLLTALVLSPTLLVAGTVLAVFWDVHHTAMQNFGIGRIYDMKAGNAPTAVRRTDLWLAYALYIGPAAAGAAMIAHFSYFERFDLVGWHLLTTVPGAVLGWAGMIRMGAVAAWLAIVVGSLLSYRRAARQGYRLPPHKLALLISTGAVSIVAWDVAPPLIAFATVNLFHAVQYFAIVWLKEGTRIAGAVRGAKRFALPLFLAGCTGFGLAYHAAASLGPASAGLWMAPFVACSLLHFWYDAFIWSVRKKLV